MITQSVKKRMIIPGFPLFSVSVPIPVNSEAVSTTTETTKRYKLP